MDIGKCWLERATRTRMGDHNVTNLPERARGDRMTQKANKGAFVKGVKKQNQGKRGPAKATKALKEMILAALDDQPGGGVEYLKRQAVENPGPFMTLIGKVLPMTVAGDPDNPLRTVARIELVALDG